MKHTGLVCSIAALGNTAGETGNPALAFAYAADVKAIAASSAEGIANAGLSACRQIA